MRPHWHGTVRIVSCLGLCPADSLRDARIAFHEDYVYVANTNEVVRFLYDPKTSKRLGNAEHILDLPGLGYNQHWTRSLAFSSDGKALFVSVGSQTNISIESDPRRAAVLIADPDGKNMRIYATGLRNAVGIAFSPQNGDLWSAVNERDDIGDDIPSDYFTRVWEGGFYGWPYTYLGSHPDNRVSARPDLVAKAIVPDLLLGAHVAPLQFAFYEGQQFPSNYRHGAFVAEHGSWNRRIRNGYQVVFIPFRNGSPAGEPTTFLSGFVPDPAGKDVYGRPAGVAIDRGGSLLISDDGAKLIWKVSYETVRVWAGPPAASIFLSLPSPVPNAIKRLSGDLNGRPTASFVPSSSRNSSLPRVFTLLCRV